MKRLSMAMVALLGTMACNLDTTSTPTVLVGAIDCSALATSLPASTAGLTTTASGLQYRDITVGTGAAFIGTQIVSVGYAGCFTSGTQFDSNAGKQPFTFVLGTGQVIKGFDEGVTGMRVGGRRLLVIPSTLAYGTAGSNGGTTPIPPNTTLVFVVDAISSP